MATIRRKGKDSYQFRVSVGLGADNKYRFRYKTYKPPVNLTGRKLKDHLSHKAYKFEQEVLSGNYIEPSKLTFEDFSEMWRTNWLEKEVSENTIMLRLGSLNNHVLPIIGHLTMDKITTLMLVDLINNLTRKDGIKGDLSISAKHEVHKALVSIFKRAMDWNVLTKDPMENVKAPTEKRTNPTEVNIYNSSEVNLLIEKLETAPRHWEVLIKLAIATGMRRGELLALEWDDINLKKGIIKINKIISKARGGQHEIKLPKYNSVRSVHIPDAMIEELKQYKLDNKKEKILLQDKWTEKEYNFLFHTENGTNFHIDTISKWWRRFLKRNKLKSIRFHDLRHTSATLLIQENVHPKIISERLGHRKISTTMDIYGQSTDTADKKASEKLNKIFKH